MSDVHQTFIGPLSRLFGQPDAPDVEAFFDGLTEDLAGFSDDTLRAAVKHIRQTRKFKTFPQIGDCVAACRAVLASQPAAKPAIDPAAQLAKQREQERAEACRLCRNDLGRQADRDGWLPALIEFAMTYQRMPRGSEVTRCMELSQRATDGVDLMRREAQARIKANEAAGAKRFPDEDLSPMLARLRQSMLNKAFREVFGNATQFVDKFDSETGEVMEAAE